MLPIDEALEALSETLHARGQGPKSKHAEDLKALEPTPEELRAAAAWTRTHDPSPGFRDELRAALRQLGVDDDDL